MKRHLKRFHPSRSSFAGGLAATVLLGLVVPTGVHAQVSEADFKALKEMVLQLNDKVQKLEQGHASDQEAHQKDLQEIERLRMQVQQTTQMATNLQQQGSALVQMQQVPRAPIDEATVNHNFLMLGDAEVQYFKTQGQHGSFVNADFAPIFLYRGGDNILFEAGFDFTLQNNAPGGGGYSTGINLSFAQIDYIVNNYLTLCAGNLLLPLGTFSERTAGWLNKIPDDPLERGLLPGNGVGGQLRGALALDDAGKLLTYSVYGVNGPGSIDGTGSASQLDLDGNVGLNSNGETVANLHPHLAGGGRVGLFIPFKPHYDLELGLSAFTSEWDAAGAHQWTGGVVDASLHLGANFELKGEYARSQYGSDDQGMIRQDGFYLQAGYKLAGLNLDLPVINNLEILGRFDSLNYFNPDALSGAHTRKYTVGFVYYLTNTLLFEGDYEFMHNSDPTQPKSQFVLQLSYGF